MNNEHKSLTEGFAIELFLDEEAESKVLEFRDSIYRDGVQPVQGLMNDKPHVSLAVFPRVDAQKLLAMTEAFAATLTRFSFRLGAVGTFPTSDNVLFLYPVPSAKLLEAHAELHARLQYTGIDSSPYYHPGNWVPHLTLEFNIARDELCRSVGVFKENFKPISGEFTQLGVVSFRPIEYLGSFDLLKSIA
ncbi:MAG: 2'-5' RNA ligase family protein [Anaerolineaceae bacterium]